MSEPHDWLPRNHTGLYQQVVLTWNYILAPGNCARMGFAPDTPQGVWFDTVFSPAFNDYGAAYVAWINPAGQHGVELGWDVSDVAPARWEDLRHSAFDTHTPEYDGECDYPVDPVAIGSGQWLTPL